MFTSSDKTYQVDHIVINGKSILGYSHVADFPSEKFNKHINSFLKSDNLKDYTIKIFDNFEKYTSRVNELTPTDNKSTEEKVLNILLSISL